MWDHICDVDRRLFEQFVGLDQAGPADSDQAEAVPPVPSTVASGFRPLRRLQSDSRVINLLHEARDPTVTFVASSNSYAIRSRGCEVSHECMSSYALFPT